MKYALAMLVSPKCGLLYSANPVHYFRLLSAWGKVLHFEGAPRPVPNKAASPENHDAANAIKAGSTQM